MSKNLRIGIVVGEASGDILGAGLMESIRAKYPQAVFEGIGGPLMLEKGFNSLHDMERLSVMGLIEPLKRLRELLAIRREVKDYFLKNPPDLFLGIDSPDFNLNLELALRESGILTAHYVSPSVWAWRQGRIKKIAKAVDRMLTLLPFEAQFYRQHHVPVTFVGHPLADQFPDALDVIAEEKSNAREQLAIPPHATVVALLPGSRSGEVRMLGQIFIETARWCLNQRPDLHFIVPAVNAERHQQLIQIIRDHGQGLPITLIEGQSREVMAASDVVLMASGTTTLEAMLLKKPMVVAYRMAAISFAIISWLLKTPYISLPNLLAGDELVPEVLQKDVRAEMLGPLVLERLSKDGQQQSLVNRFTDIHQQIKLNASEKAADVLLTMIEQNKK